MGILLLTCDPPLSSASLGTLPHVHSIVWVPEAIFQHAIHQLRVPHAQSPVASCAWQVVWAVGHGLHATSNHYVPHACTVVKATGIQSAAHIVSRTLTDVHVHCHHSS